MSQCLAVAMAKKTGFFFNKLTPLRAVHGAKLNDGQRSAPALSAVSDRSANILMMATNRGEKWGIAKPQTIRQECAEQMLLFVPLPKYWLPEKQALIFFFIPVEVLELAVISHPASKTLVLKKGSSQECCSRFLHKMPCRRRQEGRSRVPGGRLGVGKWPPGCSGIRPIPPAYEEQQGVTATVHHHAQAGLR
jgi:hypothetical protein